MIRYSLICHKRHGFEAWFKDSKSYDRQARRGEVDCPECGSNKVEKAMMAPQIAPRSRRRREGVDTEPAPAAATTPPAEAPVTMANPQAAHRAEVRRELAALMRKVREEVEKTSDYVGKRFAEEARKIHYEELPPRGIYGEATLDEARALAEEGIDVLPLPVMPEDHN